MDLGPKILYKYSTKMDENQILFPNRDVYQQTIGDYLKRASIKKVLVDKSKCKYKDAKTNKYYNNTEEFYKQRTIIYKSEQNRFKYLIKVYNEL